MSIVTEAIRHVTISQLFTKCLLARWTCRYSIRPETEVCFMPKTLKNGTQYLSAWHSPARVTLLESLTYQQSEGVLGCRGISPVDPTDE